MRVLITATDGLLNSTERNRCMVLIFNKTKCAVKFPWKIGDQLIPISDKCTHLGIELDAKLSSVNRTESACRRGRNTYFALSNMKSEYTNPLVLIKMYRLCYIWK